MLRWNGIHFSTIQPKNLLYIYIEYAYTRSSISFGQRSSLFKHKSNLLHLIILIKLQPCLDHQRLANLSLVRYVNLIFVQYETGAKCRIEAYWFIHRKLKKLKAICCDARMLKQKNGQVYERMNEGLFTEQSDSIIFFFVIVVCWALVNIMMLKSFKFLSNVQTSVWINFRWSIMSQFFFFFFLFRPC